MYSRTLDIESRNRPHLLLSNNWLQYMSWGRANYQDPDNHNQKKLWWYIIKQIMQTYLESTLSEKTLMTHLIDPFQDIICISFIFSKKFVSIASHRKYQVLNRQFQLRYSNLERHWLTSNNWDWSRNKSMERYPNQLDNSHKNFVPKFLWSSPSHVMLSSLQHFYYLVLYITYMYSVHTLKKKYAWYIVVLCRCFLYQRLPSLQSYLPLPVESKLFPTLLTRKSP